MNLTISPQQIETHLINGLQIQDPEVQVKVKRTTLGWLKIQVITSVFEGNTIEEREKKIDDILEGIEINLGQYPIAGYNLLTPQEAARQPPEFIQLPLWSDILMAPNADQPVQLDEDSPKSPLVVTFYSFKGGVGRSTALGLVAGILATRNRRVVMVDFDLEAPGISVLFRSDVENFNQEQYGVVDYLYQRYLTPEQNFPSIENCISQVNLPTRGELFLVSVGEYNENYIHRLAELDRRTLQHFYTGVTNPPRQLMEDIKKELNPDVILIDARPGFNDTNAIALFDLADTAIICFSPTDQSFEGLRWVVQAVSKQHDYQGRPDLRFLLTPMPPVAAEQRQAWITKVEKWIEENWGLPIGTTVGELYYEVPYNPNIVTLSSLVNDVPQSLLNDYLSVADAIDASLPDINSNLAATIVKNPRLILHELRFEAARAQDLEADSIPNIFQRTEDFPQFLNNRTWLIRGAKGTGKSLLFRLFVEQPEKARDLAQSDVDLSNVNFIPGHGEPRLFGPILESTDLASFEQQVGENSWATFWLNYALLQLCHAKPDLRSHNDFDEQLVVLSAQNNPTHASIVSWLVKRTQSPQAGPKAIDELRAIDNWLQAKNLRVWLLYDELDAGFGSGQQDYARRRRALEALLAWWLESGTALKRIVPKIFLREDIWEQLNFTNKGHYIGRSLQLRWEEADLWRLVLRQALNSSNALSHSLERQLGVTVDRLNAIELEQLRRSLYPLWGERMGRAKKAYTYNWVRTRIADGQKNCFPRSLILLLKEAVKLEQGFSTEYSSEIILRPKALIDAFPYVSEQRVDEVRNEYPELEEYLNRLQTERSPIDASRLAKIWNVTDSELALHIKDMVDAGIFTERSRPKDPPPRVYAVAELYLYGLKMVRTGPR
ncbi:AAA family ATPase [Scytonema sp. UIC 10036]|uniref:tyrosine-protein kinase family protein n=1 Tax=Scytonema sp. UIC 10036 TaxID=2304196 RepID=UPI0012DA1261|nr:ParA family protein [Scytonema sp. UIC 10036]MUG98372.1 AAA family ATPase [Scytonema sp. UIC 10036]